MGTFDVVPVTLWLPLGTEVLFWCWEARDARQFYLSPGPTVNLPCSPDGIVGE